MNSSSAILHYVWKNRPEHLKDVVVLTINKGIWLHIKGVVATQFIIEAYEGVLSSPYFVIDLNDPKSVDNIQSSVYSYATEWVKKNAGRHT